MDQAADSNNGNEYLNSPLRISSEVLSIYKNSKAKNQIEIELRSKKPELEIRKAPLHYKQTNRFNFEPGPLLDKSKAKNEQNSIQRTINYWLSLAESTIALPVVTGLGLDLVTRNRKFTCTKKVLGTYSQAAKWTIGKAPEIYNKSKSLSRKFKQ